MTSKAEWRARMRAWRDGLDPEVRAAAAAAAARHLESLPAYREARAVLLYWSRGSELATGGLVAAALAAGKAVCLPRVEGDALVPRRIGDPARDLAPGYRGLLEPPPARAPALAPGDLDAVVVPGLAFDRHGVRLGYGAGFYDRFLASLPPRTARLGLGYAGQVVARLPRDPWDVLLHAVVTEEGVVTPPS